MLILLHRILYQQAMVNKLVCISGCSRGLGRAMALEFAARGWKVAGGARNKGALDEIAKEIGTDHFLQTLDVTIPTQVENFAHSVKKKLGTPNLLVNNAGLINQNAPLVKVSPNEFSAVVAVNLSGIHNMIRSFVPMMMDIGHGLYPSSSEQRNESYCEYHLGLRRQQQRIH